MKTGLTYFPTDISMHPGQFAKAAEERGFDIEERVSLGKVLAAS